MSRVLIGIFMTLVISIAKATPMTFFGEDTGLGEFQRLPAHPTSDAARNAFAGNLLPGVVTEDFEAQIPTNPPTAGPQSLTLTFGPDTATLVGDGLLVNSPSGTENPTTPPGPTPAGVYPISGDQYFLSFGTFLLTFSSAQAAFGFYAIDVGDNGGQMSLEFLLAGGESIIETIPHTVAGAGGSVIFFGFIDTDSPFTGVRFLGSSVADGFGFDDMTIGRVEQIAPVPEPSTLALLALGLLGAGYTRERCTLRRDFAIITDSPLSVLQSNAAT